MPPPGICVNISRVKIPVKINKFLIILALAAVILPGGCRKIPAADGARPSIKERSLYEEYVEQFDFLSGKLKNKKSGHPSSLEDIKGEIIRINRMDRQLRQKLASKYRVAPKEIDRIIFRVLDDKLKEKGWVTKVETKKS